MRKYLVIFIFGTFFAVAPLALAQDNPSLIEQYKTAVRENDKELKEKLFLRISESPDNIEILRKQNPGYFAVFELQKLLSRIEDLKVEAKRIARNRVTVDVGDFSPASRSTGSPAASVTSNRDRASNSFTVRTSPNQSRTPNRVTSRTNNQSRTNIRETLRNRTRR